jgi:hypothetical protein
MAGKTYLMLLVNFVGDEKMEVQNFETKKIQSCSALNVTKPHDMFIPWCESKDEYSTRKLSVGLIEGGDTKNYFWLWENSGKVYYSETDEWSKDAKTIADSWGGDWKFMTLSKKNGAVTMEVKNVKE